MALAREYRLRVKLHALDIQRLVAHTHNFAVIRPRGHFEAIRQRFALNHQRVITRRLKARRQTAEHTAAVMANLGRLAVHHLFGVNDFAAERLPDRLVVQTAAPAEQPASPVPPSRRGKRSGEKT